MVRSGASPETAGTAFNTLNFSLFRRRNNKQRKGRRQRRRERRQRQQQQQHLRQQSNEENSSCCDDEDDDSANGSHCDTHSDTGNNNCDQNISNEEDNANLNANNQQSNDCENEDDGLTDTQNPSGNNVPVTESSTSEPSALLGSPAPVGIDEEIRKRQAQLEAEECVLESALDGQVVPPADNTDVVVDNEHDDEEDDDDEGEEEDDTDHDNHSSRSTTTTTKHEDKNDRFRRYLCIMIGCLTVAIIAIIVVIVVALVSIFGNFNDQAVSPTPPPSLLPPAGLRPSLPTLPPRPTSPTESPSPAMVQPSSIVLTSQPTAALPPSLAPIMGPMLNDDCTGAQMLPLSSSSKTFVIYSTHEATMDDMAATCGEIQRNGRGVWYSVVGQGRYIQADTCHSDTTFDTQLSVYSGDCVERLTCITGNDQYCGDQSMVSWFGQIGQLYYILVHGFRFNDGGRFGLTLKQEGHETCATALPMPHSKVDIIAEVSGSTHGVIFNSGSSLSPRCPGDEGVGRFGVWYTAPATEINMVARIAGKTNGFVPRLSVYRGSCDQLVCLGTTTNSLQWESAEIGADHWFFVSNGGNDIDPAGEFTIQLLPQNPPPSVSVIEPNSICNTDINFQLIPGGSPKSGSTVGLWGRDGFGSCGDSVFDTTQGVWYWALGSGQPLTVSTCSNGTDYDTQISVFAGSCDNLMCLGGDDHHCSGQSSFSWFSQAQQLYLIHVHGYANRRGKFTVDLTESSIATDHQSCSSAVDILPDGTQILGRTSQMELGAVNSNIPQVGLCDVPDSSTTRTSHGTWYRAIGDGNTWIASTCSFTTSFPARVSVYTIPTNGRPSCETLSCVDHVVSPCGNNQHAVTFSTDAFRPYWFYIHAPEFRRSLWGDFVWTLERTATNDQCENAVGDLSPTSNSLTLGSTRSSTVDSDSPICARDVNGDGFFDTRSTPSRSLWYKVYGRGETLILDACSEYTNFNIQLVVYRGSCDYLQCASTGRGTPCSVEWFSTPNELYFVVIQGVTNEDVGNFGFIIRTSSQRG